MRKAFTAAVIGLVAGTFVRPAYSQGTIQAAVPHISTSASGEARVTPDRATIFVGVQSRGTTAAAAAAENARRQRAVLDTLRALGISGDRVSTMNYNVAPEMQYSPGGQTPPRVTGYVVTNTVRAEVLKLDDVGRVIDAALAKGANELSSLQFYSSKADSVRRVALGVAVANARADAEALARAAGGSLGALIEMTTGEPLVRPVEMAMARVAAAGPRTPIEAGQQTVEATVTARWLFVPGR